MVVVGHLLSGQSGQFGFAGGRGRNGFQGLGAGFGGFGAGAGSGVGAGSGAGWIDFGSLLSFHSCALSAT